MSTKLIRQALEIRLAAMPGVVGIAWENTNATPVAPFIQPNLMFAEPDDNGYKDSNFIQRGYLQLTCLYPTNTGTASAQAMAEKLRDWFSRGDSYVAGIQTVKLERTPEISGGGIEETYYVIRVTVRFWAEIDPTAA